jgi:hypothetical protein
MKRVILPIIIVLLFAVGASAVGLGAYYTLSFPMLGYSIHDRFAGYKDFDNPGALGVTVKGWYVFAGKFGVEGYAAYTSGYKKEVTDAYGVYKLTRAAFGAGIIYRFIEGNFGFYGETGPTVQWTEFDKGEPPTTHDVDSSYNYGAFIGLGVTKRFCSHASLDINPHYTAIFDADSHEDENVTHLDFLDIRAGVTFDF